MPNKILTQFIEYYGGLSDDAKEIVRELVLTSPKQQPSSSPAPRAPRASRSASKRGLPSAASSETDKAAAGSAQAASSGGD